MCVFVSFVIFLFLVLNLVIYLLCQVAFYSAESSQTIYIYNIQSVIEFKERYSSCLYFCFCSTYRAKSQMI